MKITSVPRITAIALTVLSMWATSVRCQEERRHSGSTTQPSAAPNLRQPEKEVPTDNLPPPSVEGNWDQRFGDAQDYTRGQIRVGSIIDLEAIGWKANPESLKVWDAILWTSGMFSPSDRKNMERACQLLSLGIDAHRDRLMSIESGWREKAGTVTAVQRIARPSALLKHPNGKVAVAVFGPFGLEFSVKSDAITAIFVPCEGLALFLRVLRGTEGFASRRFPATQEEAGDTARLIKELATVTLSEGRRADAAETLGWTGDPSCFPSLIKGLEDKSDAVVIACCGALQKMPGKQVVDPLISLVNRQDKCWGTLPAMAIQALANTNDRRAIPVIIAALKRTGEPANPNAPDFKQRYANILKQLTGQYFGKDADRWEAWWKESHKPD